MTSQTPNEGNHGIRHTSPAIGQPADIPVPASNAAEELIPVDEAPAGVTRKITAFGKEIRHEENWNRVPNVSGTGAIHVRTFHAKLTEDALDYMDRCINEWLDAHPQYEVKFVKSTIGTMTGKIKEPQLICQVWV